MADNISEVPSIERSQNCLHNRSMGPTEEDLLLGFLTADADNYPMPMILAYILSLKNVHLESKQ